LKASELPKGEFHSYYRPYIETLGDADLQGCLSDGLEHMQKFMEQLPENKINFSYDKGKWTIGEVLMHLIDTERIFQYRALCFYRNDVTPLPGFNQDDYISEAGANTKNKTDILKEYSAVRNSSMVLFQSFKEEFLSRSGTASDSIMSVRALGFIISGHQKHHLKILKERYF